MFKDKNLKFSLPAILFVLLLAAFLRVHTFYLTHTNFDETAYTGLALKLDKYGFKDYAKNFNLHFIDIDSNEYFNVPALSDKSVGSLLTMSRVDYEYGMPTHRPPVFSFFLMLSHRIFSADPHYFMSSVSGNPYWHLQFYAALVPFLFSMLSIFFTYVLGKMLFDEKAGLYGALMLSLTPVELVVASKIWADTTLAFFVVMAAVFYFLSIRRNNIIFALLSGICAGTAFLTKVTGGFIILAIILHHFWVNRSGLKKIDRFFGIFFDAKIIVIIFTAAIIICPWLLSFHKSHALSAPKIPVTANNITPWVVSIGQRPWYMYAVNMLFQFPLYLLGCISIFTFFINKKNRDEKFFLISWFAIIMVFLSFFLWFKEDRYMLLAYPAIAILSGLALVKLERILNDKLFLSGYFVSSILIILTAARALKLSAPFIFWGIELMKLPL